MRDSTKLRSVGMLIVLAYLSMWGLYDIIVPFLFVSWVIVWCSAYIVAAIENLRR